jgi:hypothetical protein
MCWHDNLVYQISVLSSINIIAALRSWYGLKYYQSFIILNDTDYVWRTDNLEIWL